MQTRGRRQLADHFRLFSLPAWTSEALRDELVSFASKSIRVPNRKLPPLPPDQAVANWVITTRHCPPGSALEQMGDVLHSVRE